MMPKVTGIEMIKMLRTQDPTLPVILASGLIPKEELARHPWLEISAILPKPFTASELLRTVKEVLTWGKHPIASTPSPNLALEMKPKRLIQNGGDKCR